MKGTDAAYRQKMVTYTWFTPGTCCIVILRTWLLQSKF